MGGADERDGAEGRDDEEVPDDVEQHWRRERGPGRVRRDDPGREAELGGALDRAAHAGKVVDEPEQDVREAHEDGDLDGDQPGRRRSDQGRDPRDNDDECRRAKEERHVGVRPRGPTDRLQRDADEDQHVDDLCDRGDEIERAQGSDSMNLASEQNTNQGTANDDDAGMQTTLIREARGSDAGDDLPP